jgi:hypothetical protein
MASREASPRGRRLSSRRSRADPETESSATAPARSSSTKKSTHARRRSSGTFDASQGSLIGSPRARAQSPAGIAANSAECTNGSKGDAAAPQRHRRTSSAAGKRNNDVGSDSRSDPSGAFLSPELFRNHTLESSDESQSSPAKVRPSASPLPLTKLRRAAELGKAQLGVHNDQYIEDISVESVTYTEAAQTADDLNLTVTHRPLCLLAGSGFCTNRTL